MEEEKKEKVIDINPLGKWKRILMFLGDYAITFILSFILFNLLVFPLGRIIYGTEKRSLRAQEYEIQANQVLIDGGLIFEDPVNENTLENDVNYTFKVFLSYYAFESENSPDINNPQYGHKAENEVIRNYYLAYLSEEQYLNDFAVVNEADQMFEIGTTADSIKLKSDYVIILSNELIEITDEDDYSETMIHFRDNVFARLFYINIYKNNILDNDFVINDISYMNCLISAKAIYDNLKWVPALSSIVSLVMSWGAMYLLIPMINSERKTITMMVLKANKLNFRKLDFIDRKVVGIQSFYHLVTCLSFLVFLPVIYFGISYCFNLPLLFVLSASSFVLLLVSLFLILFNEHNRSGMDILTSTVVVPASELDTLYREEFYGK